MKFLVCDDDPVIRYLLKVVLGRRGGHEVTVIEDPDRVLAAARTTRPDLVVLDQMMGGLHGTDVAARLRADPVTRAIPIVLLTGRDDLAAELDVASLGIVGIMTKPFDTATLAARLAAAAATPASA